VGDPLELRQARKVYEEEIAKAKDQYTQETAAAPQKQIDALLDLEKEFQSGGDLRSLLAVQEERKRFTANPSPSEMTPVEAPRKLRALQMAYLQAHADRRLTQAKTVVDLYQKFMRHLAAVEKDLTRKGRIEDALKVMQEQERLKTDPEYTAATAVISGTAPAAGPAEPATAPKSSVIGTDALSKVVHGEIVGWNALTGDITVKYDFSAKEQIQDWEGGTLDDVRGRLRCENAPALFAIPFKSVARVEFEGYLFEGDGGIKLRLGKGLTAEVGAGEKRGKMLLYQNSELFPIATADRPVEPYLKYASQLSIDRDEVAWSVNAQNLNRGKLTMPIPSPFKLGLGSEGNRTTYDNVLINGVLSMEHLRTLL
jgi:hypothetical protein